MPSIQVRSLLFTLSVFLAATCSAQTTYKIHTIVFDNPGPYSQAQLLAVSGVHPGDPALAATLQAGAQKLADTGFFDDIGADFSGSTAALVATFHLKPTPRQSMLPLGFENFVWLTPDELTAAIHTRVPLFGGYIPEAGIQADLITQALQQALAAKGIHATIQHETFEPTLEHPLRSIAFRVSSPRPVVANIHLEGVTPDLVPLVQKSVNATARHAYNDGLAGDLTTDSILAPLFDAGYIDAALSNLSLETPAPDDRAQPVVLHATLAAGATYHLSALHFAGTPLMSPEAFAATAKLHPGDIASHAALLQTLAPLDEAYRKQGFNDVIIQTAPAEDAATHQVAYTITVTPGQQYHLAKVTPQGLDDDALADFNQYFLLKPGDVYNPIYVKTFIKNNTAIKSLAPYNGSWKAYADPNNHTVELIITFYRGPSIDVH